MAARPLSDRAFLGIAALLFAAGAAVTVAWCASMSGMPGMDMPGGWSMSMAWMRMPAQTWLAASATFLGMWSVMMLAMMLPAITPALRDYRRGIAGACANSLTLRVAAAYFGTWMLAGAAVYPLGLAFAEAAMRLPALSRAVPVLGAAVLLAAGLLQLGQWKQRQRWLPLARPAPARGGRRGRVAPRLAARCSLRHLLCSADTRAAGRRGHGPRRDGRDHRGDLPGAAGATRSLVRADFRPAAGGRRADASDPPGGDCLTGFRYSTLYIGNGPAQRQLLARLPA
jgi:hypothetical protein